MLIFDDKIIETPITYTQIKVTISHFIKSNKGTCKGLKRLDKLCFEMNIDISLQSF